MSKNNNSTKERIADICLKIEAANRRIAPFIIKTPLKHCSVLSKMSGAEVYLKCENLQHTGSFKLRGALTKILLLQMAAGCSPVEVIAASTGNHGLAVAYAAQMLNAQATIYLPRLTDPQKQSSIESLGAKIVLIDGDGLDAENKARLQAEANELPYISPYNDEDVVTGQGTTGYEINEQADDIEAIFVTVGGGGLISGIASYFKSTKPNVKIIGCWPENAPAMLESMRAEKIVEVFEKPTLSTATAGGLEAGSVTFPLCKQLIDDCVTVTEKEISQAIRLMAKHEQWLIEGAAAVAVAAFEKVSHGYAGKKVAIVLCGRNISAEQVNEVMA